MLLIDANNLFYKCYSINNSSISSIIRLFVSMISSLITQKNNIGNNYNVFIIWDTEFLLWRKELYKTYKANRINKFETKEEMEKFFNSRIELRKYIYNFTVYRQIMLNHFEADDIIAYYVRKYIEFFSNEPIIICSNDKDFQQLLRKECPTVIMRRWGMKKKIYTITDFIEQYGITPDLWSSVKSLAGDSGDNVPGVYGIGEKRALDVVKKYGHVLEWIDKDIKEDNSVEYRWIKKIKANTQVKLYFKLVDLEYNHSMIKIEINKCNTFKWIQQDIL